MAKPKAKSAKPRVSTYPPKPRSAASKRLVAKLDKICMALPDATEQISWGAPTWRVRGKIFAQLDDHHHGSGHVSVWIPAPAGAQEALVEAEPERFFRPPYVGHKGWLGVRLDVDPDWDEIAGILNEAYRKVAPKRLIALLDASTG